MNYKLILRQNYLLLVILALALILRFYSISDNHIFFYFDQARDAVVSSSIITNADIKIQGPSVSGTNDSVYHGVLYYYVIAPIYALSNGSPYAVSIFLSCLSLLGIYIVYLLGTEVFNSKKVGLTAAFLHAVSAVSIHQGTWLSNPQLSGIFIPLTYYFIWKLFLSGKKQPLKVYLFFGVSSALAVQAALQNITLFGSVAVIFIYSLIQKKYKPDYKKIAVSIVAFFIGISSMILTQILMYKRGILSLQSLNLEQHETTLIKIMPQIIFKYYQILVDILATHKNFALPAIVLLFLLLLVAKLNKKQLLWSLCFFLAPLWLLVWHYRDPPQTFIGIETITYLLIATGLTKLHQYKNNFAKLSLPFFLIIFTIANIFLLSDWRTRQHHHFGVIQNGAFLQNQLALIDATYAEANGNPFSISSLTSPYAINTTWDYLYRWYGQSKYGYTPFYIGIDQQYFVTNTVLSQKFQPENIHFIIFEPDTTLSDSIQNEFLKNQYQTFGEYQTETNYQFGSLNLKKLVK